MLNLGYKVEDYKNAIADFSGIFRGKILVMREGDEPRLDKSRKKAGTKLTMAGLIIELTNACKAATSVLEEAHLQNLYLQGKVASLEQVKLKVEKVQLEMKNEFVEIKETLFKSAVGNEQDKRSFASVVGDSKSLVEPMKMAFKQMKKEDSKSKYRSVIMHGLSTDVEDDYKDRRSTR